jgi:porphyrinogen peroxidase
MPMPQTGIFALGTMSHAYLEFDAHPDADAVSLVRDVAGLREPRTTIGGVNVVAGFRPELWATVAPDAAPRRLRGFNEPVVGRDGYTMPATQHDVVVWITGASYDSVFDVERLVAEALRPHADVAHEMIGWPYHHDHDLTGFVDGTENPTVVEAPSEIAIEGGQPGEGGSVLLLQQWQHDARAWETLPVADQERAMGRQKAEGEELDPLPPTSHVARTDQDTFGRILRRNIGYGTLVDHGTIFSGFARDRERLEAMLESMVERAGHGRDDLTRFTRPLTGAYYFVPATEALARSWTTTPRPA